MGQPRATVRRALLTLAHLGYVQEEGRLFSLTPRVLQLAAAYLGASHAATLLQPCCERLAAEYSDTFSVAALDGESAVMIAYATPRRMYMDAAGVGLRLPAFCSAVGRVLLAGLPQTQRDEFLERLQPQALTPHTVTNKDELRQRIVQVADEGFAMAEEEAELEFPLARGAGAARGWHGRVRTQHRYAGGKKLGGGDAGDLSVAAADRSTTVRKGIDLMSVQTFMLAALAAAAALSPATGPSVGDGGVTPFYVWEQALPKQPGQTLRQEPLPEAQRQPAAAESLRILYSSTDGVGQHARTVVSGALYLPKGTMPAGGWPLVAWAHGTTGIADVCAPSWRGNTDRDREYLDAWLSQGFAVVATDYQGLGTPGGASVSVVAAGRL